MHDTTIYENMNFVTQFTPDIKDWIRRNDSENVWTNKHETYWVGRGAQLWLANSWENWTQKTHFLSFDGDILIYGSLWKRYYIPALTYDSNKEGAVTFVNPSHFVLRSIKSKQRKRKYMLRVFFDTKCWGPKAADLSCVTKSVCFPQVDVNISLALAFSANNKVNLLFPIMGTNFDLCASNLCRD